MGGFDPEEFDPRTFDPASVDRADFIEATPLVGVTPGEVVRELRALHGWTQRELAERTGIAQGAISAIERGQDNVGIARAKAFARAFEVHPAVIAFPNWKHERDADDAAA